MIILYSEQVTVFIFFLSKLKVHPVAIYVLILVWLLWYNSLFLTLIILLFWTQSCWSDLHSGLQTQGQLYWNIIRVNCSHKKKKSAWRNTDLKNIQVSPKYPKIPNGGLEGGTMTDKGEFWLRQLFMYWGFSFPLFFFLILKDSVNSKSVINQP